MQAFLKTGKTTNKDKTKSSGNTDTVQEIRKPPAPWVEK